MFVETVLNFTVQCQEESSSVKLQDDQCYSIGTSGSGCRVALLLFLLCY